VCVCVQISCSCVAASTTSISEITPSAIGYKTRPTFTLYGLQETPTSQVAFSAFSACSTLYLPTNFTSTNTSTVSAAASWPSCSGDIIYYVCYTEDGIHFFAQADTVLLVVRCKCHTSPTDLMRPRIATNKLSKII